jgi:hypothetical protein
LLVLLCCKGIKKWHVPNPYKHHDGALDVQTKYSFDGANALLKRWR